MGNNVVEFPKGTYGTELVGPFLPKWKVVSYGHAVPNLSATMQPDGQNAWLILDERFMIEGPIEEIQKWVPFIANCMAVAAGYSCHGENSREVNPYKVKVSSLEVANIE